ncbi:TetR/AcrR family transcriptional regulator [Stutzerimonas zhaodongensis]|uniref:TetR/AcrR family transcriptional regulator n=1 Tax=Stutzerimonas zhaodongensis TaxID=1176257 RepID=UPI0021040F52|nr:TetR/AcrR family transcriptional regulator [Stutzerimonas zhaodongensis]MCQ2031260.1 TetR/AcrR family transcriptional regulator [Stutzerimonas zhaodongensis]
MTSTTDETAPIARPSAKAGRTPRKPQQDRGHERVASILDACARVLQRDGEAGLTMHHLAKESGTSIGSLYHFFPDKKSVLAALNQRHTEALCAITKRLEQIDDQVWKRLSTVQLVERLIVPFLEYIIHHPDIQVLLSPTLGDRQLHSPVLRAAVRSIYEKVLHVRLPNASAEDLRAYSAVLLSIPSGMLHSIPEAEEAEGSQERIWLREIPRALVAYLDALKG